MNILVKRNLKLYFRDKSGVCFSLLAVLITIILYAVFLGNVWATDEMVNLNGIDALMNSWLVAGLLAIATVTTTMGAFGVIVDDRAKKISKDFYSTPIKRGSIVSGYILNAFIVGVIMSVITLILAELFIVAKGGALLTPLACIKVIGLILLASITNTAMVGFIISFFKSHSAFGTASTILGTLIGFLTGIYLPIGSLPESVQIVIKLFPVSHAAALLRQVLMEAPIQNTFDGIPTQQLENFMLHMGIVYRFGDYVITPLVSILVLVATAILFYSLTLFNMRRMSK